MAAGLLGAHAAGLVDRLRLLLNRLVRAGLLEEFEGKLVGLSTGNAEAQHVAAEARLDVVLVTQVGDFGGGFLPVFGVSKVMRETEIPLEVVGLDAAQEGRHDPSVEIETFL
jgi:hypothetical protein